MVWAVADVVAVRQHLLDAAHQCGPATSGTERLRAMQLQGPFGNMIGETDSDHPQGDQIFITREGNTRPESPPRSTTAGPRGRSGSSRCAGGAGVLALHSREGCAFLDEAGVVDDEDPVGFAEVVDDVCLQVVADVVGVPGGSVQEPLQAVGGAVACVFGQLPAVCGRPGRARPGRRRACGVAGLRGRSGEAVANTQEEVVAFTVPGRVGKVVDHAGRLPSSQLGQFSMPLVGGAVRQDRL